MVVQNITTQDGYDEMMGRLPKDKKAVVIFFTAKWCGPCHAIDPVLEKFSQQDEFREIYFARVDVDELPEVAAKLKIRGMPTFMAFTSRNDGGRVDDENAGEQFVGATPRGLQQMLIKVVADIAGPGSKNNRNSLDTPRAAKGTGESGTRGD